MEDIKIKTIDDHLVVSGKRQGMKRCFSLDKLVLASLENTSTGVHENNQGTFNSKEEIFQVFELPDSVDPYSMTAKLTERHQLVINATLTSRSRQNTM